MIRRFIVNMWCGLVVYFVQPHSLVSSSSLSPILNLQGSCGLRKIGFAFDCLHECLMLRLDLIMQSHPFIFAPFWGSKRSFLARHRPEVNLQRITAGLAITLCETVVALSLISRLLFDMFCERPEYVGWTLACSTYPATLLQQDPYHSGRRQA